MAIDFVVTNSDGYNNDGTAKNGKGGTEMVRNTLLEKISPEYWNDFKIIHSRVRDDFFEEGKHHILLCHDLWSDPEVAHLQEKSSRERFAKIAFVSNHQFSKYNLMLGIPYSEAMIMPNAIEPFGKEEVEKSKEGPIRLIYHTTPHRGLHLLVPAFEFVSARANVDVELDVFSSFEAYGWAERDEPYRKIFDKCREHPKINYHGYQPNEVVREALKKAHVFAYPSIWEETSCIAAMEAMSAKCVTVCSNYGALPETTSGFAVMYQHHEDPNEHVNEFATILLEVVNNYWNDGLQSKIEFQKVYADGFYNWNNRIIEWETWLKHIRETKKLTRV